MRVFLKDINIWISRLSKADGPPQCEWASSIPLTAWTEQNGGGMLKPCSAWLGELGCWSSALDTPGSDLQTWTGIYSISSVALRPGNYTTSFPAFPACRQQITGLLSLHNCVSQVLIISLILDIHMLYWICFCGQPWLISIHLVHSTQPYTWSIFCKVHLHAM